MKPIAKCPSLTLTLFCLLLTHTAQAYYDPNAGRFLSFDPVPPPVGSFDGYSFCSGDPINHFDPDGRFGKGVNAGLNSSPVPADASQAFMAGYYGGGVTGGFDEGLYEGSAIVADTATLGQVADLHSYTSTLQGGVYDWSRGFATVGVGSAVLASGGWAFEASPALYVAAVNASANPWTYVAVGGIVSGAYSYSQGGSAGDVGFSTVVGAGMTYVSSPFPIMGNSAPLSIPRAGPLPPNEEPYQLLLFPDKSYTGNRASLYGYTPTAAQTAAVPAGMEFDHTPTLVQHYYEGPGNGTLPGFNLTQTERIQYGASLQSGSAATAAAQRAQGATAAQYSRQQNIQWGFNNNNQ